MSFTHNAERGAQFQRRRQLTSPSKHTYARRAYEQLRASIRSGLSASNSRLSETDLSEDFGASRNSVRAALSMLAGEGLISRGPRNGTVVTREIVDIPVDRLIPRHFAPYPDSPRRGLRIENVEHAVVAMPPAIATLLDSDADRILTYLQVGLFDGAPLYVRWGLAPLTFDGDVFLAKLQASSDDLTALADETPRLEFAPAIELEAMFRHLFGRAFGHAEFRVEATSADAAFAELLGVEAGAPILSRQQINCDAAGVAREFSFTHYRGDRTALSSKRRYAASTS